MRNKLMIMPATSHLEPNVSLLTDDVALVVAFW